jgi:hypothetical protein
MTPTDLHPAQHSDQSRQLLGVQAGQKNDGHIAIRSVQPRTNEVPAGSGGASFNVEFIYTTANAAWGCAFKHLNPDSSLTRCDSIANLSMNLTAPPHIEIQALPVARATPQQTPSEDAYAALSHSSIMPRLQHVTSARLPQALSRPLLI